MGAGRFQGLFFENIETEYTRGIATETQKITTESTETTEKSLKKASSLRSLRSQR